MLLRVRIVTAVLCMGIALLSPASPAAGVVNAPKGRLFYVTHALSDDIAMFRVGQGGRPERVGELVKTGDGTGPSSILFAPDGRTAYVANRDTSAIAAYRVGSGGGLSLLAAESTGGNLPFGLAIAPDGRSLFASNILSDTVTAFTINDDGTLKRAGDPISTGFTLPRGLGVSLDGRFLYVGHGMPTLPGPDFLVRFAIGRDGALRRVGRPIPTNPAGAGMVFTPDGRFLYLAAQFGDVVDGFRVGRDGDLTPIPGSPTPALPNPEGATIAPDGRHLFIASPGHGQAPDLTGVSAYSINLDGSLTPAAGSPFPTGGEPVGIETTPDGRHLLAVGSSEAGKLSAFTIRPNGSLDLITDPPVFTGGTAPRFQSVAVIPNQGPVAALTVEARPVGRATHFDARGTVDPDGQVVRYDWDFGDGTTLRDGGPVPAHTYDRPGRFTATVTVTDDENCSTALVFTGTTVHCNGSSRAQASQTLVVRP